MKVQFFSFLISILLFSCQKENSTTSLQWIKVTPNIKYQESEKELLLESGKHQYRLPISSLPYKRIILLNASLIGYITELGEEVRVVGVSSPEYIYSDKLHQLLDTNKIQNVGNEQKYDVEKIISLQPDAVFTNYVGSFQNTYDILEKSGIKVIFIDEYLEEKPLEKSAIIKLFGLLLGIEKKANAQYNYIENQYQKFTKIASNTKHKPSVLTNELYGNQWFLAGGKSQLAYFLKDAHAHYIFGNNTEISSQPKSFEEVFAKAKNADSWVNVGNHKDRKELIVQQPLYAQINAFQKGKMYALIGKEKGQANDYFESGVVRADRVLKDYIVIFHPEVLPKEQPYYMRKLK